MTTLDVRRALPVFLLTGDGPDAEGSAEHVRNALMVLGLLQAQSPAVWVLHPELARAAQRTTAAMVVLAHNGPVALVQRQLRAAIQSLVATEIEWDVIRDIPAACHRLFRALFALDRVGAP
jgi:hypothetical protein